TEAAVLHREGGEGLLQDPGLQIALDWREKSKPNAAWARRYHPEFAESLRYLNDSSAARDAAVAERERQREEQIARERRELEQAQLYAEQQHRAARRLRFLSIGMAVMCLLALATAVAAFSARRQARQSERMALGLRDDAVKQQKVIAALLESEKGEKQKAREAEDAAEIQATFAKGEKKKADDARHAAVAALATAQQQTKIATAEKIKADAQRVKAEHEVKKNQRAREANDNFRDGV